MKTLDIINAARSVLGSDDIIVKMIDELSFVVTHLDETEVTAREYADIQVILDAIDPMVDARQAAFSLAIRKIDAITDAIKSEWSEGERDSWDAQEKEALAILAEGVAALDLDRAILPGMHADKVAYTGAQTTIEEYAGSVIDYANQYRVVSRHCARLRRIAEGLRSSDIATEADLNTALERVLAQISATADHIHGPGT
ncbi:hypothetical protein FP2506_11362 [Fulvimarina pelagi HTCC2506]|uniref:Uncharacterized protein n=1 Tax=Fulvimarina pelagi HTCC2506 TaxID=314231 RepID=Q0FZ07_9HYPH|nr:hypothetical protein [Fulvimarina pelagi]EAU40151.1 hypothetical protein FP2506_11362 [Fulvimarina pelagi HTCC2506]